MRSIFAPYVATLAVWHDDYQSIVPPARAHAHAHARPPARPPARPRDRPLQRGATATAVEARNDAYVEVWPGAVIA